MSVFLRICLIILVMASTIVPVLAAFDPFKAIGLDITGKTVPISAPFTDDAGHTVRFSDLLGKRPLIVAPVYYKCPNTCGTTLSWLFGNLAGIKERSGYDYDLVVFSIDPHEQPEDAAAARTKVKTGTNGVYFLTGPEFSIAQLTDALGFRYQWDDGMQQYAHPVGIAMLTPQGRLSRWLYGFSYGSEELSGALAEASGSTARLSFGERILLLCHAYNPVNGKYTGTVWTVFRIAGALTIFGIVLLIAQRRNTRRRIKP